MKTIDVRVGDLKLALPADWEHEVSFIARAGTPSDAHRPNVRVTYRSASEPIALERLAGEYHRRLADTVPGKTTVVRQTKRVRGGQELIELVLAVELSAPPGGKVHHQAVITIRDRVAITVAASRQSDLADTDIVDALTHTLASVGFGR